MSAARPLLLDLFCGAGGAAMGYHRVGFDVVGVDIVPQPNYPFDFIQGDALKPPVDLGAFALIHASPPCQAHTTMGNRFSNPRWPDLVAPTRAVLSRSGVPWVIENVPGAKRSLRNPVELTGDHFGLTVYRPRLFELGGWYTLVPPRPQRQRDPVAVYGKPDGRRVWTRADGTEHRAWSSLDEGRAAMEVPWMTDFTEIAEAIPPAYTEYIGRAFLDQQP